MKGMGPWSVASPLDEWKKMEVLESPSLAAIASLI